MSREFVMQELVRSLRTVMSSSVTVNTIECALCLVWVQDEERSTRCTGEWVVECTISGVSVGVIAGRHRDSGEGGGYRHKTIETQTM